MGLWEPAAGCGGCCQAGFEMTWVWRSCWGGGSWEIVPVSYGAVEEENEQSRVIGVLLVQPLGPSCPGISTLAETVEAMSTNLLLIWYSIWSRVCSLHCLKLFHYRCSIPDFQAVIVTLLGVLSLKLQAYFAVQCCSFSGSWVSFHLLGSQTLQIRWISFSGSFLSSGKVPPPPHPPKKNSLAPFLIFDLSKISKNVSRCNDQC